MCVRFVRAYVRVCVHVYMWAYMFVHLRLYAYACVYETNATKDNIKHNIESVQSRTFEISEIEPKIKSQMLHTDSNSGTF